MTRESRRSDGTRAYHHGDLARTLIEAAVEVLGERGAAGLSLREVARRAGVSHGAPAHHFPDKASLLTAVAVEGFQRFTRALGQAAEAAHPDPMVALGAIGRAYVHFAVQERAFFELMFRPEHLDREASALKYARAASYQQLLDVVTAAQDAGFRTGQNPVSLALASWAKVHGLATLWLDGNLAQQVFLSLDEAIDQVLFTDSTVALADGRAGAIP